MSWDISNSENILDSRDIIKRIEELEEERGNFIADNEEMEMPPSWEDENEQDAEELKVLTSLQGELEGYCDWNDGATLIKDSYFVQYCKELVKELGELPEDLPTYIENNIDWDGVAEDLQVDYTSGDYDGVTYWVR